MEKIHCFINGINNDFQHYQDFRDMLLFIGIGTTMDLNEPTRRERRSMWTLPRSRIQVILHKKFISGCRSPQKADDMEVFNFSFDRQ